MKRSESEVKWIERVSYLLDEQFRVPGTRFRFGLDPVLNLFPVLGDLSGFIISSLLVLAMIKNGASGKLVTKMTVNVLLDTIIGGIPLIGHIFDFYYKANTRNIRLLKEHYHEGRHRGSGKGILITAAIILLIVAGLICYGLWKLAEAILNLI